ncbi:putative serine protease K12H4.7 [Agrilus planipennis]|uniref:Serine protease K12H4.7 n=1 Tax=Agrilus planipennis TaxID=224129 RepID=A0A7F5R3A8_AGRPL|nr:putative serine protease K12H4.7 [Agrilus planipennis]
MATLPILFLILCVFASEAKIFRNLHAPPPIDVPVGRATVPVWANITQRVDHFNPVDKRTWKMRYLYNDECFVSGGPIFIYLGGEWTITTGNLMTGPIYDIACENGGYMFYTEHRYYGESQPTSDWSSENLKYLSADQALADIAYFIKYQKENVQALQNSSVVAIGGSYSATLATWLRIKYPHFVDIAYASSAPLNAKEDFYEYHEVVNDNLVLASSTCPTVIRSAISEIETMLESEEGIATVSALFRTCQPINNTQPSRAFFFNAIAEAFASLVQYSRPGDIESACFLIENTTGSNPEKLASYVNTQYTGECMGLYNEFLDVYTSPNITADELRQWHYQTCTEYGWFQTSTSNNQPLGNTFPLEMFNQICKDIFGLEYDEEVLSVGVERTNAFNGADTPEISRLISVHGSVDPWHAVGLLRDLHSTALTFVVQGSSHCADLRSASNSDSEQIRQTKLTIRTTIARWLDEIKYGTSSGNSLRTSVITIMATVICFIYNF